MYQMNDQEEQPLKSIATVRDVARMVGLSSARFYQLKAAGVFPQPEYHPDTGRPYYTEEQQRTCLEVRQRNCGINGAPVLFYARRSGGTPPVGKKRRPRPKTTEIKNPDVLASVRGLGLTAATGTQVDAAVKKLFPKKTPDGEHGEVIRAVFLYLKRQDTADNVGG
jgi:hypothetical protein